MKRADWVRELISAGSPHHYLKKDPWTHNLLNGGMAGLLVVGIIVVLWAGLFLHPLLYLPLAALALGNLYFGLFILVIHECSHNMFMVSRDRQRGRRLNHWIGRGVSVILFTNYIEHWEHGHRVHHLRPGEPEDTQSEGTLTGPPLRWTLTRLALIPGYAAVLNPSKRYASSRPIIRRAIAFWAVFAAVCLWLGAWPLPVAAIMAFNVLQGLNLIKKSLEHGAGLLEEPDPLFRTQTYFTPLGRLISPFNINYHFEHHLNFTVPWYDLPRYHARVAAMVPDALHEHVFNGDGFAHMSGERPQYDAGLRALISATEPERAGSGCA
jgi:fatty acid desaturase